MNIYAVLHYIVAGTTPTLVGIFRSQAAATRCKRACETAINGIFETRALADVPEGIARDKALSRADRKYFGEH